jgi:hypothetical protein
MGAWNIFMFSECEFFQHLISFSSKHAFSALKEMNFHMHGTCFLIRMESWSEYDSKMEA